VIDPYDWKYSSHKHVLNGFKEDVGGVINHELTKPLFSHSLSTYTEFVQAGVDEITSDFYSKKKLSPIFGSEDFVSEVKTRISLDDKEVDRYQEYQKDKVLPKVLDTLSKSFNIPHSEIYKSRRGHFNYPKSMAIALLKELTNMTYKEISESLHQKSPNSVKSSLFQLRQNFKKKPDVHKCYLNLKSITSHRTT